MITITVARKPLSPGHTVAENVVEHGTGGLNIDASRIACEGGSPSAQRRATYRRTGQMRTEGRIGTFVRTNLDEWAKPRASDGLGRWPANLLLSEEAAEALDAVTEPTKSTPTVGSQKYVFANHKARETSKAVTREVWYADEGGPSRYFKIIKEK